MSFCINCGNGLNQDDLFCQSCGSPVTKNESTQDVFQTPIVQQEQQTYQPPPQQQYQPTPQQPQYYQPQPEKKKSILPVILIILLVLFVVGSVGGYFAYKYIVKKASDTVESINTKVEKEITKEIPKDNKQTKTEKDISETVKENESIQEKEITKEKETQKIDRSETSQPEVNTKKNSGTFPGKYPEGSKRLLNESDLIVYYGKDELKIMRNEIFARHGYIFKTDDLKSYFSKQSWYTPQRDNVDNLLSNIEKKNIATIKSAEKTK